MSLLWGFDGLCGEREVTASDGQRTPEDVTNATNPGHAYRTRCHAHTHATATAKRSNCPKQRRACCLQARSCAGGRAAKPPGHMAWAGEGSLFTSPEPERQRRRE